MDAARRGTEGPTQGTHAGDPHRGPTQGTHTGDPHRGEGPTDDPPPEGRAHTGDPHRTNTDSKRNILLVHIALRLPKLLSDQFAVRVCSSLLCI